MDFKNPRNINDVCQIGHWAEPTNQDGEFERNSMSHGCFQADFVRQPMFIDSCKIPTVRRLRLMMSVRASRAREGFCYLFLSDRTPWEKQHCAASGDGRILSELVRTRQLLSHFLQTKLHSFEKGVLLCVPEMVGS